MMNDPVKLMVTIVHRGKGEKVLKKIGEDVGLHYLAFGQGTASSEVLEVLGVGETEKDVVFSLVPASRARSFMEDVHDGLNLHLPNGGIVFIVSTTAVSKVVARTVKNKNSNEGQEEVPTMNNEGKFSLVLVVVNRGYTDDVMDAATKFGARGGTVLHARGLGSEEAGKFLGVKLQPEKEMIMLVVRQKDKVNIMNAIAKDAGMQTKAGGFLLALPVDDFSGLL